MSGWRFAFSLSNAQVKAAEPPGTSRIIDHHEDEEHIPDTLILVPMPTTRADDPLTWPRWRKISVLLALSFYVFVAEYASAVPGSVLPIMAYTTQPPTPFAKLTPIMAYNVLLIGLSNIFWVPLANTFGRRNILIVAALIMTLASVWIAKSSSLNSLVGARAVQGIGMGPCFTLPATMIGEVFYLHQSGRAVAFYVTVLGAGPLLGGITGGYIASNLGVTAVWWISTGLSAAVFCIMVVVVPETLFDRTRYLGDEDRLQRGDDGPSDDKIDIQQIENNTSRVENLPVSITYCKTWRFCTYRPGFLRELIKPIYTVCLPGVWVVTLQAGSLVAGVITMSIVGPQILAAPPYNWGANVGLFNLGGIVGMTLALLGNYLVIDNLVQRRARQQADGFAEPESRLPLCAPGLFLATAGLLTFGFAATHPGGSAWAALVVGNGMLTFGLVMVPGIAYTYIVDSYRAISGDCFVVIGIVRGIISCVWTFYVGHWIESAGPALTFGIFAAVLGSFSILTIPLFFYGKRLRIATAKYLG